MSVALLPPPKNKTTFVGEGETEDIITQIGKTFDAHKLETKALAPRLLGENLADTLYNIWAHVVNNAKYVKDPDGVQYVKSPSRMMKDGYGDCKSYSIFIASVLYNLGIPHYFRYVSYIDGAELSHVYIIVPKKEGGYYTVDACLPQFNEEKPFAGKPKDVMIKIYEVNGVGANTRVARDLPPYTHPSELELRCIRAHFIRKAREEARINGIGCPGEQVAGAFANYTGEMIEAANSGDPALVEAVYGEMRAGGYHPVASHLQAAHTAARRQRINYLCKCRHEGANDPNVVRGSLYAATENLPAELRQNAQNVVMNLPISGILGVSGYDEGVGSWFNDAVKSVTKAVDKVVDKGREVVNKVVDKVKDVADDAWDAVKKYNPLSVLARNAFLLLMKLNVKGWAREAGRGLLSREEAIKRGYSEGQIRANADAWHRFSEKWKNNFGGDPKALANNVREGMNKTQLLGVNAVLGVNGIGEPMTVATALTTASAIIGVLVPLLKAFQKPANEPVTPEGTPSTAEGDANASGDAAWDTSTDYSVYTGGDPKTWSPSGGTPPADKKDNTMMYVLGGVALVGAIMMTKGGRRK